MTEVNRSSFFLIQKITIPAVTDPLAATVNDYITVAPFSYTKGYPGHGLIIAPLPGIILKEVSSASLTGAKSRFH